MRSTDGGDTWNDVSASRVRSMSPGASVYTSTDGTSWTEIYSKFSGADDPTFHLSGDDIFIEITGASRLFYSYDDGSTWPNRESFVGPMPGDARDIGVVGCEGAVAISTPRGLLRVELDGDISLWGAGSQRTVVEAVGTSTATMANWQAVRGEDAWLFVEDPPRSAVDSSRIVNLAWGDELYAGGLDRDDRGILYRRCQGSETISWR